MDGRSKAGGAEFVGTIAQYCLLHTDDDDDRNDVGGDDETEEILYSRCCPLHMSTRYTKRGLRGY